MQETIQTSKTTEDIPQYDCISTNSSSLRTDISSDPFKCLCTHLPKTNESHCLVTESGIGSSISSIDAHLSSNIPNVCLPHDADHFQACAGSNLSYSKYDCHDLPPVTEEDDSDALISVINSTNEENIHLDVLPWHDVDTGCNLCSRRLNRPALDLVEDAVAKMDSLKLCQSWCDHTKPIHDDFCLPVHDDSSVYCHLPNPWLVDHVSVKPILSPMCHDRDETFIRSEICFSNNSHSKSLLSNKDCCYTFHRRHSMQNTSLFNCRPHFCIESRAEIFADDNDESQILSRAAERVVEWLKLSSVIHDTPNPNSNDRNRTFRINYDID